MIPLFSVHLSQGLHDFACVQTYCLAEVRMMFDDVCLRDANVLLLFGGVEDY